MNMVEWVKTQLRNPSGNPLPVLSFPGIQLIGVTVRELVHSGELQAICMKAIADRYPTLASVSNMDLSVEAEAFGATTRYSDDEVPSVTGRLVQSREDAERLVVPAVGTARTGECIKAVTLATKLIKDRPVLAGVIGPFSLAGRLMDLTEIMYMAVDEPETVHLLLEKATDFLIDYIRAFKRIGANGVVMAEPAAGLLSPDWNDEFSAPYVKRIVDAVQDESFMVVYHNCGNVIPMMSGVVGNGAMAYHFGNAISLPDAIARMPADRLVLGNIDPSSQFANGTPESIRSATLALLEKMEGHSNFILSSGCDIPPQSPLANIDAFFQAAADFEQAHEGEAEHCA